MRTSRHVFLLLLIVSLSMPSGLRADTWLPLEDGRSWSYGGLSGSEVQTVEGTVIILGRSTKSIVYSPSTHNEGLRYYWSVNAEGDVLLHGTSQSETGSAFVPPIVMLDVPLWLGKTWSQTIDVYDLPDEEHVASFEIRLGVVEEGLITVPAGSFPAFGIRADSPEPSASGSGPMFPGDGPSASGSRGGPANWYYAEGVGVVRYVGHGGPYDLLSTTAVEIGSWASIKSLYR